MLTAPLHSPPLWQMPRISSQDRWLAGVAGAIAAEIGVAPLVIRIGFVLLTLSGGIGLALYAAAWLSFTFHAQRHRGRVYEPIAKGRSASHRLLGVASIVIGVVLFSNNLLDVGADDARLWPVALAAFGMLLAWSSGKVDWAAPFELLRAVGGLTLAAAGVIAFIALNFGAAAAPKALLLATAILSGVVLVVAPWLWRAASQVSEARADRRRASERAELAAHLHDSVLQTLSLIQRSAGDRTATLSLARRQERELRDWLSGKAGLDGRDFRARLMELASEVEALHGVPVEVVVVGEAPIDEGLSPALSAAREAMVNAAKHSGALRVDVYAELCAASLELFVRDTGRGFDPAAISADRRGVGESIIGRMQRAGGQASITSEPGRGTEVALMLPRRVA